MSRHPIPEGPDRCRPVPGRPRRRSGHHVLRPGVRGCGDDAARGARRTDRPRRADDRPGAVLPRRRVPGDGDCRPEDPRRPPRASSCTSRTWTSSPPGRSRPARRSSGPSRTSSPEIGWRRSATRSATGGGSRPGSKTCRPRRCSDGWPPRTMSNLMVACPLRPGIHATRRLRMSSDSNRTEDRDFRAPRSRVWRALTNAEEFGAWFGVRLEGQFSPGNVIRGNITSPGYEHLVAEMTIDRIEPESAVRLPLAPGRD